MRSHEPAQAFGIRETLPCFRFSRVSGDDAAYLVVTVPGNGRMMGAALPSNTGTHDQDRRGLSPTTSE
jgi:hypothetical protein